MEEHGLKMLNERRIRIGDRVTIYRRGRKGVWTADYWWRGQHCRTSLKTRVQRRAEKLADRLEIRLQDGLGPIEKARTKKVTILQATDEFLAYQKTEKKRSKTCVKYQGLFKTFIAFANSKGVHEMRDVDLRLVDRFREYRRVKIGDRSMHNDGVMLKTFFGWCVERQLMATNPLGNRKFRRPRYEPRGGPSLAVIIHKGRGGC
jgi:hypothetical protein